MEDSTVLLLAIAGGILPALFWLWFWLREDRKKPEPTGRLVVTFMSGMVAAVIALELESLYKDLFLPHVALTAVASGMVAVATIEELVKYAASYFSALKTKVFDEPIDAPIYMITAALGFAALENILFLYYGPMGINGDVTQGLINGNIRFIGATLLHVLASATVGIAMALAYYRSASIRIFFTCVGLGIAVILHTAFNYLIIESDSEIEIFTTLALVWLAIIILLLFFEKIKNVTQKHHATT